MWKSMRYLWVVLALGCGGGTEQQEAPNVPVQQAPQPLCAEALCNEGSVLGAVEEWVVSSHLCYETLCSDDRDCSPCGWHPRSCIDNVCIYSGPGGGGGGGGGGGICLPESACSEDADCIAVCRTSYNPRCVNNLCVY